MAETEDSYEEYKDSEETNETEQPLTMIPLSKMMDELAMLNNFECWMGIQILTLHQK